MLLKIKFCLVLTFFITFSLVLNYGYAQERITYENVLQEDNWIIEQQPGGKVIFNGDFMEIIDAKGCTVWFKNKLETSIKITYDVTVIDNGGPCDRVSDLNCFWMANDPKHPDNFFKESKQRAGHFPNYHHLKLYYVGYGGHNNSKTRFRRYNGNVNRPLLSEHDLSDKKYMITANKKMHIEILIDGYHTIYKRDGTIIFEINDPNPYLKGYFGFRTVNNHMKIENFRVSQL
ncbi:DUF6250 domain-containing protein [Snuella sedimenti]|uniref:DUF6250 domain-containing protein n=1 Tax=Snuella sedimenti TaxID=2798802 RepID=A0A8J7LMW6_9FLAO|nr:DUF6250 domain-containing protein [Snuella sedimenti]MBJ6368064.1 hypothetical protein [Snuella sedimenti]